MSAGGIQCGTDPVVRNATYEPSLLFGADILQTTRNPSHTGRPDHPPTGAITSQIRHKNIISFQQIVN